LADYDVGYGKPPAHTRWAKGQSGNPRGRPRNADKEPFAANVHPVRDMILEELARPVEVKEGGRTIELETLRAIVRSINLGAIKGNRFQQKLALEIASDAEQARKTETEELIVSVEAYKATWGPIFDLAARSGSHEPSQLPHPDHVEIDPTTLDLVITGPLTWSEKRGWDYLKFQLRETEKLILEKAAVASANPRDKWAARPVEMLKEQMAEFEERIPPGWNWREELGWEDAYAERILS